MPDSKNEILRVLAAAREYAEYLGELGVETIDYDTAKPELTTSALIIDAKVKTATEPIRRPIAPHAQQPGSPGAPIGNKSVTAVASPPQSSLFADAPTESPSLPQSTETLEEIWRDIGECTRCALCEGRTQVVNTFGNRKARLMFIGEAPGADEDAQGKPFVGRAGQLLTKIIEAIGMKREDVIIGNVNRCRPPGNRQPTLEEAAICRPFLFREIAAVQPDVIVVMGNTALRNLLEIREGITRVRGQFQDFQGIKVMPTFHPAYLLRDPSKKRETWEDMKKVKEYLDSLQTTRLNS